MAATTKNAPVEVMRIHGRWYNVSDFQHPGGPIMLSLGYGRDATALFEAHHPLTSRSKLAQLLRKYEVPADEAKNLKTLNEDDTGAEFVWPAYEAKGSQDGAPVSAFARDLHTRVKAYFQEEADRRGVSLIEATKATPFRWTQLATLAVIMLYTAYCAFFHTSLLNVLAFSLAYWVLGVNIFHDASHFGLSRDWRVNCLATYIGSPLFSSPLEWYHQHVIGHHAYPNIPRKDPDLYHNATMERHTKTLRWRSAHQHQHKTFFGVWMIGLYGMNFIKAIQLFVSGQYNRSVDMIPMSTSRKVLHIVGRIFFFGLVHVLPFFLYPLQHALMLAIIPSVFSSVCFMASSQVNHLTPENIDVASDDYYKHQVLTSHCFAPNSFLVYLFTGGLNFQIEHHLFPCINHTHLSKIHPIVKAVCQKHGVFYHESATFTEALTKYVRHLRLLSTKPKDE
eukprot:m.285516 g.285516  ORF g.285516 m.285516 type:complete len:450 (+) comp11390_c0_seq1:37-1386(+)